MDSQVPALTHVSSNHNLCKNKMELLHHTVTVDNKSSNGLSGSGSLKFRINSSELISSTCTSGVMKTPSRVMVRRISSELLSNSNAHAITTSSNGSNHAGSTKYKLPQQKTASFLNTKNRNDVQNKVKSNGSLIIKIALILGLIITMILITFIVIKHKDIVNDTNKTGGLGDGGDYENAREEPLLSEFLFGDSVSKETILVYPNPSDTSLIAVFDEDSTSVRYRSQESYMAYFDDHLMRPVVTFYGYEYHPKHVKTRSYTNFMTRIIKPIKSLNVEPFQRANKMTVIPNGNDQDCYWPKDNVTRSLLKKPCSMGHLSPHSDKPSASGNVFLNWVTQSSYMNIKWNLHVELFLYKTVNEYHKYDPLWIATGSAVPKSRKKSYMTCSTDKNPSDLVCIASAVEVIWKVVCNYKIGSWVMWHGKGKNATIHRGHPKEFVAWLKINNMIVFKGWEKKPSWFGKLGLDTILLQNDHDPARRCFQNSKNNSNVQQWNDMFEEYKWWAFNRYQDDLTVERWLLDKNQARFI